MGRVMSNLVTQNPMYLFSGTRGLHNMKNRLNNNSDTLRKIGVAASIVFGMFGEAFVCPTQRTLVLAKDHASDDHIHHIMEMILDHAIWHQAGHVLHLGSFASGVLGGLLTFQPLGERDSFHIPKPISKPIMTKCINPRTGMMVDCLRLENGREIMGQDILMFYRDLQSAQILKSLEKGGKS